MQNDSYLISVRKWHLISSIRSIPYTIQGLNERGYWVDLTGKRVFFLYETDDPKVVMEANSYWTDIVKIDSFQVMDIKDAMELMQRK